jgi:hypothetical protein
MEVLRNKLASPPDVIDNGTYRWPYLGEVNVGHNDNVDGARGILRGRARVTTGVVLVLALSRAGLPGHAVLGERDGVLGCGRGRGAACRRTTGKYFIIWADVCR